AEALGQDGAAIGDQIRQIIPHHLHGAVPAVQGLHGGCHDGLHRIPARSQGLLRHIGTAAGDLAVPVGGGGPGVCQVIGRLPQELLLLPCALVPDLP
ncbi:DUF6487 domain-containing protein, partial [Dysosmobacter welbionis]